MSSHPRDQYTTTYSYSNKKNHKDKKKGREVSSGGSSSGSSSSSIDCVILWGGVYCGVLEQTMMTPFRAITTTMRDNIHQPLTTATTTTTTTTATFNDDLIARVCRY